MSSGSESSSTSIIPIEDFDEENQTDNYVDEKVTIKCRGSSKPKKMMFRVFHEQEITHTQLKKNSQDNP
ncbi:hypothetical protein BpHYR1_048566 [Brachionus plicatilis]|uniref:Uncharacterized protein n=1 Tax=Brachionus plicatilis TaxID=10195 RepID=A0A3M7PXC7_BRAPC|nr:hypothetical protein BpHYR1_048566 [Brachionus plicatilis]